MNKYTYTIGRSKNNDFVIDDPSVSRVHLRVELENMGKISVEDLDSSNGTLVNGRRIRKSLLVRNDQLLLGNYQVDVNKLLMDLQKLYQEKSKDYSIPFKAMISDFETYEQEKRKIMNSGKKSGYIRVGLSLLVMVILLVFPDIIPDNLRYPAILSVGILGSIFAINGQNAGKRRDELDLLQARYEDNLTCPNPNCKAPLINRSLAAWKEMKKCRKCGVRYFGD